MKSKKEIQRRIIDRIIARDKCIDAFIFATAESHQRWIEALKWVLKKE